MAEQKKQYLRTAPMHNGRIFLALGILALAFLLWLFFGKMIITMNGYCQVYQKDVVLAVPADQSRRLKPGMEIVIQDVRGTITDVWDTQVYSYEDLGYYSRLFHLDEEKLYHLVEAKLPESLLGIYPYSVITGSVSPLENLNGGD